MNCNTCQIFLQYSSLFWDGKIPYCFECVKTKKIDEETVYCEPVEWNYCDYCQQIIINTEYIGPCDVQIKCIDMKRHLKAYQGFEHLCKDCSVSIENIHSCLLCKDVLLN